MAKSYLPRRIERLKEMYYDPKTKKPTGKPISNFDLMNTHIKKRKNQGVSDYTLINDVMALTEFTKVIDKPVSELSDTDIDDFFEHLNNLKKSSAQLHKTGVRLFLTFAGRQDLAELCKFKRSKTDTRLPEDMLTQEEIEKLIDATCNLRDRALIAVMYETGARRGELIDIQIKHASFDENGAIIILPKGKTGARRVRVVWAAGYLRNWLDNHPLKDNRDAFIWASFRDPTKTLEYVTILNSLKRTAKKAGITKRVNPHSHRHSRATHLAKDLTEQELKGYLGWTAGSDMAARYVHLSGRDIDNAILKAAGIQVKEADQETKLKVLKCPRCREIQDQKAKFCFKCGLPLTEESTNTESKLISEVMAALVASGKLEDIAKLITEESQSTPKQ